MQPGGFYNGWVGLKLVVEVVPMIYKKAINKSGGLLAVASLTLVMISPTALAITGEVDSTHLNQLEPSLPSVMVGTTNDEARMTFKTNVVLDQQFTSLCTLLPQIRPYIVCDE